MAVAKAPLTAHRRMSMCSAAHSSWLPSLARRAGRAQRVGPVFYLLAAGPWARIQGLQGLLPLPVGEPWAAHLR
jgi:hypothetical protein